jgi:hypothetical protein
MTLDDFFDGREDSRLIFDCLYEMIESIGPAEMRVQLTQIAFLGTKAFAYVTMHYKHQQGRGAPLILYMSLRHQDSSPRWRKIAQLPNHWFTHYIDLCSPNEVDDQVHAWLQEAWRLAA